MIDIRGLTKRFGHQTVLDGIDLSIEAGERVVVIGPSGTGKTMTANAVAHKLGKKLLLVNFPVPAR